MNPVVETFSELFEKLKDRSAKDAEKAQPPKISSSLFSTELFEEALQMAKFFPGVIVKAPGDTIRYEVDTAKYATIAISSNPETPIEWIDDLPKVTPPTAPVKRFRKNTKRTWG